MSLNEWFNIIACYRYIHICHLATALKPTPTQYSWLVGSYGSVSGLEFYVLDSSAHHRILLLLCNWGDYAVHKWPLDQQQPMGRLGYRPGGGKGGTVDTLIYTTNHSSRCLVQAVVNSAVGTGTSSTQSTLSPPPPCPLHPTLILVTPLVS